MEHLTRLLIISTALSGAVFGQAVGGFGAISGMVRDASGAVVPNAKVVVSNEARGISRQLTSNDSGIFSAVSLPPFDGYKVVVNAPGFNTFTVDPIGLEVGKVLFVDSVLEVAGNTVQVNLEAPPPLIEPSRTD